MTDAFGPLGQTIFDRTYSRDGESWPEAVRRVVRGNTELVDPKYLEVNESEELEYLFNKMGALPAGRHLWASGSESGLGLFNCWRAGWGPEVSDHFTFLFDQLMLGGGVGANYSSTYLQDFAPVGNVKIHFEGDCDTVYVVPDSREGWVGALKFLFDMAASSVTDILFDTSLVRPEGSPIRGFGGIASGPGPLKTMLSLVADILNETDTVLTPIAAMEIDHAIASCVIAGNVRRSARMSIIHWKDPFLFQFLALKQDTDRHWSTNISVEVDTEFWDKVQAKDDDATGVLRVIVNKMLANGEPGFYNSSLASEGERGDVRSTNPCGEIALEDGEPCVLGHVNLAHWGTDVWGAREAARLMTRFLIRATFAEVTSDVTRAVLERNRRIGVGLFGVQEWAAEHGVRWADIPSSRKLRMFLKNMVSEVETEAQYYSRLLGVVVPVKTRTIAPTGTIAKLPGVSEGIHPIYAKHFIQRVRYASSDVNIPDGYAKEDCLYSANTTVVSIPTRNPILDKYESQLIQSVDEIPVRHQLRVQAWFQRYWADNAVSFTANINEDVEKRELYAALFDHGPYLKGSTVFPDASRPQAPYERVTATEYTDWAIGYALDECATGACPVK